MTLKEWFVYWFIDLVDDGSRPKYCPECRGKLEVRRTNKWDAWTGKPTSDEYDLWCPWVHSIYIKKGKEWIRIS